MAISVGGIEATLDTKIAPFLRAMDAAEKKMDNVEKTAIGLTKRLESFAKPLATFGKIAAGVGTAVAGSMLSMTKATADYGSQIKESAGQTNVGVEAIQGLKFATEQVGGSLPALTQGLRGINLSAAAAARGVEAQAEAYARLGVETQDINGQLRSSDQIFLDLAEAVRTAKDENLAMDDAFTIVGRSAFELRETLLLGRDGIQRFSRDARDLGLIMSGEDVEAADDFGDSIGVLKSSLSSLSRTIAIELIPTLNRYINETLIPGISKVREFASTHGNLIRIIAKQGGGAIAVGGLASGIGNLIYLFQKLSKTGGLVTAAVAGLAFLGLEMKRFADDAEDNLRRAFERAEEAGRLGAAAPEATEAEEGEPAPPARQARGFFSAAAEATGAPSAEKFSPPTRETKTFASAIGDLGKAARGADEGFQSLSKSIEDVVIKPRKEFEKAADRRKRELEAQRAAGKKARESRESEEGFLELQLRSNESLEQASRDRERIAKKAELEEELNLQRSTQAEVLSLLQNRHAILLENIEERRALNVEVENEQLEELIGLESQIATISDQVEEDLKTPWERARESVFSFGEFAQGVVGSIDTFASGLADTFATTLVAGIGSARQSFGQLFKQFMQQIAAMIARAVVLSTILSLIPGGGGFTGSLRKFFGLGLPADDPSVDQRLRGEGGRVIDLLLGGMQSRLSASGMGDLDSRTEMGQGVTFAPVVEVHEATEMTWVRIVDRHVEPRLRERENLRTAA